MEMEIGFSRKKTIELFQKWRKKGKEVEEEDGEESERQRERERE